MVPNHHDVTLTYDSHENREDATGRSPLLHITSTRQTPRDAVMAKYALVLGRKRYCL